MRLRFLAWLTLRMLMCVAFGGVGGCHRPATTPAEGWDVVYLGGSKIGYTVTRCRRIRHRGQPAWHWTQTTELILRRFGQETTQRIIARCVQGSQGQLLQGDWELVSAQTRLKTTAVPEGSRLRLTSRSAGEPRETRIPWQADWGGLFVMEQSLQQEPLSPGESRTLQGLAPLLNRLVTTRLTAADYETTDLGEDSRRLLRVEATATSAEGVEIKSTLWLDDQGQICKTVLPELQQQSYRVTREIALAPPHEPAIDVAAATMIPVSRTLTNPHQSKRAVYRVTLKSGIPRLPLTQGVSQSFTQINDLEALVTVNSVRPDRPATLPSPQEAPEDDDLASTSLVPCDDPLLVTMAQEVEPFAEDVWQLATALERYVHDKITRKDFSSALASAADVARSRSGDCTEHAVLLAALCRARNLPCRVAVGLVYVPTASGFGFHMWNEVWIRDRWVPLDATLGLGGIGAAHLKITDSAMPDAGAFAALLPVMQWIGQMDLEVVEFE